MGSLLLMAAFPVFLLLLSSKALTYAQLISGRDALTFVDPLIGTLNGGTISLNIV